jgi:hypothetical protein
MAGYVIIIGVVCMFSVALVREFRSRRNQALLRKEQELQPLVYNSAVAIKRDPDSPPWVPKGAFGGGFRLSVRADSFQITSGVALSAHYIRAPDARISAYSDRSITGRRRQWIQIEATEAKVQVKLAVCPLPSGRASDAWTALVAAGAIPLTDPPQ